MKHDTSLRDIVVFLIIFAVVLVLMFDAISLFTGSNGDSDVLPPNTYRYVIIDGMPCVQGYWSLSCDWSYWTGSIDGERVIVPGRE